MASSLLAGQPAQAASLPADAVVRAAHLSPTTPGVDVYLSPFSGAKRTTAWLSNIGYGKVTGYQALTPGLYTVAMRPTGASPNTPAMLSWTLDARSGAAYTVAGVGAGSSVRGVVIPDSLTAPPAGQGRIRVIQAASRAPVATLSATSGTVIAPRASFASVTNYATLPAGVWNVRAVSTSMPSLSTTSPVDIKSGQITSILLLDAKSSGITLRTLVDSAAAAVAPIDAVPAGAGGTAMVISQSGSTTARAPGLLTAGLLAGVALVLATRGRLRGSAGRARHAAT
ncbi:MAG: DUF4397 domain-containing protein [Actinomycetota bacterium]|nr:DUF4397 domain-containing protein [Actinomycetota bacterium]MDQ2959311.1 DUF4397 domain-containing protein [Actinomycetota bacterium]